MPKFLQKAIAPCLFALLAACTAPATNGAAAPQEPAAKAPPAISRPLPPNRLREAPVIDNRCEVDTDCAVKNVGNCCGEMPACVNKDSPTDPAAVKAQCQAKGMMGVCGFRELTACQCDNGQCVSAGPANPEPSSDPVEPVR